MKKFNLIIILSICNIINSFAQQVLGCTDPVATNYNAQATINDGSCLYGNTTIQLQYVDSLSSTIAETSGMIYLNGTYWTHVDNDNTNIYAFDTLTGTLIDSISLWQTRNKDWEAIAKHGDFIYIGDFGNNATGIREDLLIYKIKINELTKDTLAIDSIQFHYQDQTQFSNPTSNQTAFDAEAFIVGTDSILIFTKNWLTEKTVVYAIPNTIGNHTAIAIDSFNVNGLVTDAYYDDNKKLIVLLGYNQTLSPFIYLIYDFTAFNFKSANKRMLKINGLLMQTEAISSADNLNFWVTTEQVSYMGQTNPAGLYQLDLKSFLDHYINPKPQSIHSVDINTLSVFPNPSEDFITVPLESAQKAQITIIDITGKQITNFKTKITNEAISINIQNLASGVYMLRINNQAVKFTKQ